MYDLTWTERTSSNVARRWRFYVDPGTRLPHKIESYQKRSVDTDYRLRLVKQVEYLSDAEMKAVIGKVFP
jgi:hypothetical protein